MVVASPLSAARYPATDWQMASFRQRAVCSMGLACGSRALPGYPAHTSVLASAARAERYCLHVHLFVRTYVFAVVLSTVLAPARSGTAGWSCAAAHPLREDPSMPLVATDPAPCEWPPGPQTRWPWPGAQSAQTAADHTHAVISPGSGPRPFLPGCPRPARCRPPQRWCRAAPGAAGTPAPRPGSPHVQPSWS